MRAYNWTSSAEYSLNIKTRVPARNKKIANSPNFYFKNVFKQHKLPDYFGCYRVSCVRKMNIFWGNFILSFPIGILFLCVTGACFSQTPSSGIPLKVLSRLKNAITISHNLIDTDVNYSPGQKSIELPASSIQNVSPSKCISYYLLCCKIFLFVYIIMFRLCFGRNVITHF